ncbi:hypothetical protein Gogos_000951 [Gossypium gossypioides]|uniref:Uncharacterized protein n=1 Tax=Gossypium gossypioides TaxID=34282 RepID=A0A7J9CUF9_GOSGO|nr:hypothetical protein [Gossypium gossypioides]
MVVVEETLANLFISEEEEVALPLGSKGLKGGVFYGNYFVGSFLTSSVINFQSMRSTLANVWHLIGGGSWNFNSHLIIMHRLKDREDHMVVPLVTMDFWLGHEEGFCLIWILQEKQDFELEWDITLRAPTRQVVAPRSIWLRQDAVTNGQIKWNRGMTATGLIFPPTNMGVNQKASLVENIVVKNNVGWAYSTGLRNRAFAGLIGVLVQSQPIGLMHVDRDEVMCYVGKDRSVPHLDGLKRPRV